MHTLYNSDHYVVMQFDAVPSGAGTPEDSTPSGFEIVDKVSRRGIYLEGAAAQGFRQGVQALIDTQPDQEALEDFLSTYATLAQQPLALH
jgi:Protein of unknown function (DUF3567)